MKEIDRIAKRVGALQGKKAYGMLAFIRPYDEKIGGYRLDVNFIQHGKFIDTDQDKGGVFPSRKHASDYADALIKEYNIAENDVKIINIVSPLETLET